MVLEICPRCKRVFPRDQYNTDVIHDCDSGNETLDNEDVLNITGLNWNRQGLVNEATTKARIRGADVEDLTRRGVRTSTHRTRKHYEYINYSEGY